MAFSPSPGTDAQLAARAGAGDEAAFASLYERHHGRLVRIADGIVARAGGDAEGIVQEAWVRAHGALAAGTRPDDVGAWLRAIVRNASFDELDRIAARPRTAAGHVEPEALGAAVADPAEALLAQERLGEVIEDLHDLTDGQRRALTMHVLGGEAHEDVSRALGVEVGAVKALIHRARRQMHARRQARTRHRGFLLPPWPAKAVALAALAAVGGLTAGAITQRVIVEPRRAPAWVPSGHARVDRAVPPGGRLPRGLALVEARVPLPAGEKARRGAVTVRCPAGHAVVDWLRPAAVDPDVLWASFDVRTREHRYVAGAPGRARPASSARVEYAALGHLPAGRALTFSILCARRTPARDRAIGARR
jgi:RNA polymerase sigma factor (sigma-70 family)